VDFSAYIIVLAVLRLALPCSAALCSAAPRPALAKLFCCGVFPLAILARSPIHFRRMLAVYA